MTSACTSRNSRWNQLKMKERWQRSEWSWRKWAEGWFPESLSPKDSFEMMNQMRRPLASRIRKPRQQSTTQPSSAGDALWLTPLIQGKWLWQQVTQRKWLISWKTQVFQARGSLVQTLTVALNILAKETSGLHASWYKEEKAIRPDMICRWHQT